MVIGLSEEEKETFVLFTLAQRGNEELMKKFLESRKGKIDVNRTNYDGRTALFSAIEGGHLGIVKLLIENGASVNVLDNFHYSPLKIALEKGFAEISNLIKDKMPRDKGQDVRTPRMGKMGIEEDESIKMKEIKTIFGMRPLECHLSQLILSKIRL